MNPKIIKMVKRLRVDSHRDISHVLRHINLPTIDNDSDNEEVMDAAEFTNEKVLLKSNITKEQAEQSLEIEARQVAEPAASQLLEEIYNDVIENKLGQEEEAQVQEMEAPLADLPAPI